MTCAMTFNMNFPFLPLMMAEKPREEQACSTASLILRLPRWQSGNPPANAGDIRDLGSIPEWGRSPGVGNGNPFQYSCLENPMD